MKRYRFDELSLYGYYLEHRNLENSDEARGCPLTITSPLGGEDEGEGEKIQNQPPRIERDG